MRSVFLTQARVFLPFAAGYFLSYLFRAVNAVIAPNLAADLGIGPSALGLLTSSYFVAFAAAQLPLGVLLDRFGPRKVEAFLLLFAALGAFLFATSGTMSGLVAGRALIGFGVSACLMAAFKAYTMWFSSAKWPLVNGFQMAAGGLGALTATAPVEAALRITDWRGVFMSLAALTLVVALVVFIGVPEKRTANGNGRLKDQLAGVREVFTSLEFWCIAPFTTLSQACLLAIQGLWAGPWLRDVAGLERMAVAEMLMWTAIAMIAGFILLGTLAERLSRRGIPVRATAVTGMVLFMLVQLMVIVAPNGIVLPLWIGFGFFGTSGILAYTGLSHAFPVALSGRVTTALNLLVFVAAFVAQWAIGSIIGLWPVGSDGTYTLAGYRAGFGAMLVLETIGLGWFIVTRRALRCRQNRIP